MIISANGIDEIISGLETKISGFKITTSIIKSIFKQFRFKTQLRVDLLKTLSFLSETSTQINGFKITNIKNNPKGLIKSYKGGRTKPFVSITFLNGTYNITVLIHPIGSFQFWLSNLKKTEAVNDDILISFITGFYKFIKDKIIFEDPIPEELIYLKDTILNKAGMPRKESRPVPYSFYGLCPSPGSVVDPYGTLYEGYYYPSCRVLHNSGLFTRKRYAEFIKKGYKATRKYWEKGSDRSVTDPDELTATQNPRTKIAESRLWPGLENYSLEDLKACIRSVGLII